MYNSGTINNPMVSVFRDIVSVNGLYAVSFIEVRMKLVVRRGSDG